MVGVFQLILNPIRDWNEGENALKQIRQAFQLILNPIRDWNKQLRGYQYFE